MCETEKYLNNSLIVLKTNLNSIGFDLYFLEMSFLKPRGNFGKGNKFATSLKSSIPSFFKPNFKSTPSFSNNSPNFFQNEMKYNPPFSLDGLQS